MKMEKIQKVTASNSNESLMEHSETMFPSDSTGFVNFIRAIGDDEDYIHVFLNYLLDGYKKLGYGIEVKYDDRIEDTANVWFYDFDNREKHRAVITINREKCLAYASKEISFGIKLKQILVHELMHPLTRNASQMHPSQVEHFKGRPEDIGFSEDINALFSIAKQSISEYHYGLTDLPEFVAEVVSKQDFQIALSKIEFESDIFELNMFVQIHFMQLFLL